MGMASGAWRGFVVVAMVAAVLGLAAPPAAAAPALTVTPATGLLDQQIVTVTGSGFAPGDWVIVAQCPSVRRATWRCNLDPPFNTTAAYGSAETDGSFSATLRLSRVIGPPSDRVSCAENACSIVAVNVTGGLTERARTDIDFAPTGTTTVPDATLAIATPDMRADGAATATWSGSGYLPWFVTVPYTDGVTQPPLNTADYIGIQEAAYVAVCTSPPAGWAGCERFVGPMDSSMFGVSVGRHEIIDVAPDGTVAGQRPLPRMWETHAGWVDCAVADCSFALEQDGAPRSNIVDVAWASEWAPWPSARAFVVETYVALVGRAPTASERSVAIAGLTDRSLTGYAFLRQLVRRSDGLGLAELARLYQAALGRGPDADGLLHWASELRRTGSMAVIAGAFGRSPEFRRVFGRINDFEAVHRAYVRTLGRDPSVAEYGYWVGRLEAGMSRTHLVHLFSRTPEFVAREALRSEVTGVTVALVHRRLSRAQWDGLGPGAGAGDEATTSARFRDAVLDVLSSDELIDEVG